MIKKRKEKNINKIFFSLDEGTSFKIMSLAET